MSHFTKVAVKVTNQAHLVAALQELGYTVETDAAVRGWQGRTTRAAVVAKLKGADIGFVRKSEAASFEMVADWMMVPVRQDDFRRQVEQEYAAAGALASAKQAGWRNLRRERQTDGTLVILGDRSM